jgi:predicted nucleic acid-binding protein
MLAIDTNLIVRYLTGDHPEEAAKAKDLIDGEDVFVGATVLLETEWVLRSVYRHEPMQLAQALTAFARLPRVTLENPILAAKALDWMRSGMDFADALHLAAAVAVRLSSPLIGGSPQWDVGLANWRCERFEPIAPCHPARRYCTASSRRNR